MSKCISKGCLTSYIYNMCNIIVILVHYLFYSNLQCKNFPDLCGLTFSVVFFLYRFGHLNVAHILLENGAEINGRNRMGASVLTMAARGGHTHVAKLLLEHEAFVDDFDHLSVAERNVNGNNSNHSDNGKNFLDITALLVGAQQGHEAMVRLLLEWGADVNFLQKTTGWTALMLATLSGKASIAQHLVERGADPDQLNVLSKTAFEVALHLKQKEVKNYLDSITTVRPQPGKICRLKEDEMM